MSTPEAATALKLGRRIAEERGVKFADLFLAETLESENARRLVLRQLRKLYPARSFESLWSLVEEQLGHGLDMSRDLDPIERCA